MSPVRKAMQCPRVGCSEWAMFAVEEDVHDGDILLWRCSAGHRGPHVVGVDPAQPWDGSVVTAG